MKYGLLGNRRSEEQRNYGFCEYGLDSSCIERWKVETETAVWVKKVYEGEKLRSYWIVGEG